MKDKIILKIGYFLLLISIIPLIIASFSNHMYADDYGYGRNAMRILIQNAGVIEKTGELLKNAVLTMYTEWCNWSGCYTSFFFSSLAPGVFGDEFVCINVFILLGLFLLLNYISFRLILIDILKLDKTKSMTVFCFVMFMSIQFVPSIPEAFYWFNGAFYNIVGYSLGLFQFALVLKLLFNPKDACIHRTGLLAIVIGILFAGTNYSFILLYMVFYFALFIIWCKKRYGGLGTGYAFISILVFYLCSFINIMAPGNTHRQQTVGAASYATDAIVHSIMSVGPFIRENTNLLQILIVIISIPLVYECARDLKFDFKYPFLFFIISYLSLAIIFTPTCYALQSLGPDRTQNLYYFWFILLIYINIFYLCGWIKQNAVITHRKSYIKNFLYFSLIIVILILNPKDNITNMTSCITTRELLNGDLKIYDEEVTARHALYNDPDIKEIALEPLTVNPKCLTVKQDENISTDPKWWVNKSICTTYDKDLLYIKSD